MKFGLLEYRNTINLGDEIQSLAARRLLPGVDYYIDRDDLGAFQPPNRDPVAAVIHGWFGHTPENWPPAPNIHPLLISIHLSQTRGRGPSRLSGSEFLLGQPVAKYLHGFGPVGARDLHTLRMLEANGIESYFSGCLSLTLERKSAGRDDFIVLNDVPDEVVARVTGRTRRQIVITRHIDATTVGAEARLDRAQRLLASYERAHSVVTTRLHCAMPCLALGTPVLLLDVAPDRYRFEGLENYVRHGSVEDFLAGRIDFDCDAPEPNREDFRKLRNVMIGTIEAFVESAQGRRDQPAAPETVDRQRALQTASRLNTLANLYASAAARRDDAERRILEMEAECVRITAALALAETSREAAQASEQRAHRELAALKESGLGRLQTKLQSLRRHLSPRNWMKGHRGA